MALYKKLDLWSISDGLNVSHEAIYAGNGYVVDASSSKKKVVYRPIYSIRSIVLCGRPYTE